MQIVINKDLSIAGIEPAEVNRGSSNADFLSIFAPFSTKNFKSVLIYFELPNGERLKPSAAFAYANTDESGIGLWSMPIDARLTELPGKVKCQLEFIGPPEAYNGEPIKKRTNEFYITVRDGIVPELPDTPTSDIYNKILLYLSTLNVNSGGILVLDLIKNIKYNPATGIMTFTNLNDQPLGSIDLCALEVLNEIKSTAIKKTEYNPATGIMTFTNLNNEPLGEIDLILMSMLTDVKFDEESGNIIFYFRDHEGISKEIKLPIDKITNPATESMKNYVNTKIPFTSEDKQKFVTIGDNGELVATEITVGGVY